VLPSGLGAAIQRESWDIPPIFELLVEHGQLSEREAFHALNMGLGMLVVVPPDTAEAALRALPEARLIGKVVPGDAVELV
jgi:phosphoribosylformylglycinamidine cyclo-ligase